MSEINRQWDVNDSGNRRIFLLSSIEMRGRKMPTYVYEIINEDDSGGERFEVIQRMSEDDLKKHPELGQPVRRIIQATAINTKGSGKRFLDPAYQASKGFTRYEKSGDGTYEKVAGEGPKNISKDEYA